MLAGGLLMFAVYWLHAAKSLKPLFRPNIFRSRSFLTGTLGNLFTRLGSGAMPFLMPLLLQVELGYPPLVSGLSMIPVVLSAFGAKMLPRL